MDISQAIAPITPQPSKSQVVDKNDQPQDEESGQCGAAHFANLLQGLQDLQDVQDTQAPLASLESVEQFAAELSAAAKESQNFQAPDVEPFAQISQMAQAAQATSLQDTAGMGLSDVHYDGTFHVDSLVGQTQRLDSTSLDADLQDGSLLQQRRQAGLSSDLFAAQQNQLNIGAKAAVAVGHQVATVAAGVQDLQPQLRAITDAAAPALATGLAVLSEATGAIDAVAQTIADMTNVESRSEGRITLQGAWKLEDPQMDLTPAMQRLMGQVEQWATATAGVQPKPNERTESSKQAANGLQWMSSDHGSGTTLTDNAVQDVQQTQDAALDTRADEPLQDMRFWLQGKQQRAQFMMEKDGQPVRVQVALRGNSAHVTFHSDQAQTRDMLDSSLEQLRSLLQEQGVELAGVSVQAQTQDGAQQQASEQRSPWNDAPVQYAQVRVPADQAASQRLERPAQGVSFYA